ncbi:MAG: Crp/Fnr family transcriptional regulator [Bacteroidota bacterium]
MDESVKIILEHVRKKIDLGQGESDIFLSLLQHKTFPRRTAILAPGELCKNQYFVIKGCLRIFYLDADGQEHNAKFAIENWWAFDIESFFDSTPAYYGIDCLEDTEAFMINQEDHAKLLKQVPAFERFYRLMIQQSFVALQYRVTQSLSLTAEETLCTIPGKVSRAGITHIAKTHCFISRHHTSFPEHASQARNDKALK